MKQTVPEECVRIYFTLWRQNVFYFKLHVFLLLLLWSHFPHLARPQRIAASSCTESELRYGVMNGYITVLLGANI
jgi:hypothetical protein